MNMKDAFRFQNKLQTLMGTAQDILSSSRNITKVENTYLRKKVMPEAEDEVTVDQPTSEYSEQITCVAEFLLYLMTEKEKLGAAIYQAKATLDLQAGLDGEIGLNSTRQELAGLFRRMTEVRNSETLMMRMELKSFGCAPGEGPLMTSQSNTEPMKKTSKMELSRTRKSTKTIGSLSFLTKSSGIASLPLSILTSNIAVSF